MYKIIGQPINLRYIANNIRTPEDLSDESKRIIKISEFGLKHGYMVAIEAFGMPNNIRKVNCDKRII